jgi:hypothetical protein
VVLAPGGLLVQGHANFWNAADGWAEASNSGPKAMAFVVMKPYHLPTDP